MTRPFTLEEQQNHNWFRPKYRLGVLVGIENYDAVCQISKIDKRKQTDLKSDLFDHDYEVVQAMKNLYQTKEDC